MMRYWAFDSIFGFSSPSINIFSFKIINIKLNIRSNNDKQFSIISLLVLMISIIWVSSQCYWLIQSTETTHETLTKSITTINQCIIFILWMDWIRYLIKYLFVFQSFYPMRNFQKHMVVHLDIVQYFCRIALKFSNRI